MCILSAYACIYISCILLNSKCIFPLSHSSYFLARKILLSWVAQGRSFHIRIPVWSRYSPPARLARRSLVSQVPAGNCQEVRVLMALTQGETFTEGPRRRIFLGGAHEEGKEGMWRRGVEDGWRGGGGAAVAGKEEGHGRERKAKNKYEQDSATRMRSIGGNGVCTQYCVCIRNKRIFVGFNHQLCQWI